MFLSTGGKEPKAAGALSMCPRPLTTDCLGGCGPLAVEGIPPGTGDPMQKYLTGKVRVASPPALEEPLGARLRPQARFEANRRRRLLGRDGDSEHPGALW